MAHRLHLLFAIWCSYPITQWTIAMMTNSNLRTGNIRWGLIALLLGLPLPIVAIAFLFIGGCG